MRIRNEPERIQSPDEGQGHHFVSDLGTNEGRNETEGQEMGCAKTLYLCQGEEVLDPTP